MKNETIKKLYLRTKNFFVFVIFILFGILTNKAFPAEPHIELHGTRNIKTRQYSVLGDKQSFISQNGLFVFDTKFQQSGTVKIDGTLSNGLLVSGDFTEYPLQYRKLYFDVKGNKGYSKLGDFDTTFPGGKLISFTKTIRGLEYGYNFGRWNFSGIFAEDKSRAETYTFQGKNIRGPYQLNSISMIENSEIVEINGQIIPKSDYDINYFLGEITFKEIIDPTEIVTVTYQSSLFLTQNANSLTSLSSKFTSKNNKFSSGLSYIVEGANREPQTILISSFEKFKLSDIDVTNSFQLTGTRIKKFFEVAALATGTSQIRLSRSEDKNFTSLEDYYLDYANGKIYFNTSSAKLMGLNPNTEITIDYDYYNSKFIQVVLDEEIRDTGNSEFILAKKNIYGGSEKVKVFIGSSLVKELIQSRDYIINENNNSLILLDTTVFPNNSIGRYLKVSYEIIPVNSASQNEIRRTMLDLTADFKIGKGISLSGEFAQTESDATVKPVQVLEEVVATIISTSTLSYPLKNANVINGTLEVFFDDTININSFQRQSSSYTLQQKGDKTHIVFNSSPVAGTTIIANYKYLPIALHNNPQLAGEAGNAFKISTDINSKNFKTKTTFIKKDVKFAPITGYNDLEKNHLESNLSFNLGTKTVLEGNILQYDQMTNLIGDEKSRYREIGLNLSFHQGKFENINFKLSRGTKADNLDVHSVDSERDTDELKVRYIISRPKNFVFETSYQERENRDNTNKTSKRNISKSEISFLYNPRDSLSASIKLGNSKVLSKTPPPYKQSADFRFSNASKIFDLRYSPLSFVTLNTVVDMQNTQDSREGFRGTSITSVNSSAIFEPFGNISNLSITLFKSYKPDNILGDSRTETSTGKLTYRLLHGIYVNPLVNLTKSSVGDMTENKNDLYGFRVDFSPQREIGLLGSAAYNNTNITNTNKSSLNFLPITKSRQEDINLSCNYLFRKGSLNMNRNISRMLSKIGSAQNSKNINNSIEIKLKLSNKQDIRINLTQIKNNATTTEVKNISTIEFKGKISKIFSSSLSFEQQRFSNRSNSKANYRGRILSAELAANF